MDELTLRLEALALPSRGAEQVLGGKEIRMLFEKWKLKKNAYVLRVLKESLVSRKLVDTELGKEIYEAALDFYASNDDWAEFIASANICGRLKESMILSCFLTPTELNYRKELADIESYGEIFDILSKNYFKLDACELPETIEKFVKTRLCAVKEEFVNKKIIR